MRLYLINRDFQFRYMGIALLVGFGSTVITLAVVLFPLFQLKILRFPNFLPSPFIVGMVLAAVMNFVIVATMSIFVTHRIAGPMFSIVRYLHLVRERRALVPLKVRDGDDLRFLVRNINDFFEYLNTQNAKDKAILEKVIQTMKSTSNEEDSDKIRASLQNMMEDLSKRVIPNGARQAQEVSEKTHD